MSSDTTKPGVPFVAPLKPKPRAFGIEPGVFRGSTLRYSGPPPVDPDNELIARVEKMSGSEMRHWLKQGHNREMYNQALAAKGNK